jgi:hypothetical protein
VRGAAQIDDEPVLRSAMHAVDDDRGYDDDTDSGVTDEWDREGDEAERQASEYKTSGAKPPMAGLPATPKQSFRRASLRKAPPGP